MTMTNDELAEAETRTVPSSAIVIAAKAMHDRGRELGWFALEWERLPEDSKERYETLASAAIAQLWEEREDMEKESTEQCRIIGAGGERRGINAPTGQPRPQAERRVREDRKAGE